MNSLGICRATMVSTHPFLHHFRGKARWYLALFVMKKDQAEAKILDSSLHTPPPPNKRQDFRPPFFNWFKPPPWPQRAHSLLPWGADLSGARQSCLSFLACQKGSFSPPCLLCSNMVGTQGPHDALHCANHLHKGGNGGCNKFCSAHQLQHWRGKDFHTAVAFCYQSCGAEIQLSN